MNTTQKNLLFTAGVLTTASILPISPLSALLAIAQPIVAAAVFAKDKKPWVRAGHAAAGFLMGMMAVGIGDSIGNSIYIAIGGSQLRDIATTKHYTPLMKLPVNGIHQQDSVKQIRLLLGGVWSQFLSAEQKSELNKKVAALEEGAERRKLLDKYAQEERQAKEAERLRLLKAKQEAGLLSASITTYFLDSAPEETVGRATFNDEQGYVEFYTEVKAGSYSGYKYNFRCYRSGLVEEMDSIVSGRNWRQAQLKCSLSLGSRQLPVSLVVRDPSDGFVSMRGSFSPAGSKLPARINPSHCSGTLQAQRELLDQVRNGSVSPKSGLSRLEAMSQKVSECR